MERVLLIFQCECLVCRMKSGEFPIDIPDGIVSWNRPDGTSEECKRGEVNILPSVCPGCQALITTLEDFLGIGAVNWHREVGFCGN